MLTSTYKVLTSEVERPKSVELENLISEDVAEMEDELRSFEKKRNDKNAILVQTKIEVRERQPRNFRPGVPTNNILVHVYNRWGFLLAEAKNGTVYGNPQQSKNSMCV